MPGEVYCPHNVGSEEEITVEAPATMIARKFEPVRGGEIAYHADP
jgi:hypothetical protein